RRRAVRAHQDWRSHAACEVHRSQGVRRGRWSEPDRQRRRRRYIRGEHHPPYTGGHYAGEAGSRRAGQPGGRSGGALRRKASIRRRDLSRERTLSGLAGGSLGYTGPLASQAPWRVMKNVIPLGSKGPSASGTGAGAGFNSVEEIVAELKAGRMVIIVDDEDRENEGDLIMAAERATPEAVAFMIRYTSGIICVPMEEEALARLDLPQMVQANNDSYRTAFTVSVDLRYG